MIADVESNMDPQDIETHLELRGAYDVRLGNLPYDEKARRCFQHHLRAVELGAAPIHTLALARIYVMGALEVEPNLKEAGTSMRSSRAVSMPCMNCRGCTSISRNWKRSHARTW